MSNAFIIVGGTGTGKTTFTKSKLSLVPVQNRFVFDNNNEYADLYPYPFDSDFKKFAQKASLLRNAVIVYEEATQFLKRQGVSEFTIKSLVEKRHRNNIIFFIFHSMRLIPLDIIDLSNFMVIFKTNDSPEKVNSRFGNEIITDAFTRIKNAPMLVNESGRKYSPHEIIPLQAYS